MSGTVISPFVRHWRRGAGPRVLLIHGLSAYSGAWWRIASRLAALGCSVSAPDLRGHGQSPSTEKYPLGEMAADLATLEGGWDLVIGHSLGGAIALAMTSNFGNSRSLLLLDPFLDAADDDFERLIGEQISELDPHATAESVAIINPSWHPEDCFHKAVSARLTSPYVVDRCLRDNSPYHHLDLFEGLRIPIMVLGSDPGVGTLFPPSSLKRIGNPKVSYRMVERTGHSLQRERPDVVIEVASSILGL